MKEFLKMIGGKQRIIDIIKLLIIRIKENKRLKFYFLNWNYNEDGR